MFLVDSVCFCGWAQVLAQVMLSRQSRRRWGTRWSREHSRRWWIWGLPWPYSRYSPGIHWRLLVPNPIRPDAVVLWENNALLPVRQWRPIMDQCPGLDRYNIATCPCQVAETVRHETQGFTCRKRQRFDDRIPWIPNFWARPVYQFLVDPVNQINRAILDGWVQPVLVWVSCQAWKFGKLQVDCCAGSGSFKEVSRRL